MLILGIDPGTATTGFGVIRVDDKDFTYKLVDYGWIKTDKDEIRENRLLQIHDQMMVLLDKHNPDILILERLFFATNVTTAIAVSEASGIIRLTAAKHKISVVGYTPMQVKLVVGGSGKADKKVMKETVKKLLRFRAPKNKKTYFDDVCDALALTICHVQKTMLNWQPPIKVKVKKVKKIASVINKVEVKKGGEKIGRRKSR